MDCIFCSIANGEIPSSTVYEDDQTRVILDINPAAAGHLLVLPKTHCTSLLECDDALLGHVMSVAKKAGNGLKEALACDGVNILANCYPTAGQSVPHFHVHVIPRYENQPEKDGLTISQVEIGKPDADALAAKIAQAIR